MMKKGLFITLKAWPVIALATIGLCSLTQTVAGWLGITLPDQQNIEIVKQMASRCFQSWKAFGAFSLLILQVVVIMPILEELVFRLPVRFLKRWHKAYWFGAAVLSVLFSAAHYLAQPWPDSAFAALFFFGMAQCWLYKKTGRIWFPILNHALFNLTNLGLMLIF